VSAAHPNHRHIATPRFVFALLALCAAATIRANPPAPAPEDLFPRAAPGYVVAVNGVVRWAREPDTQRPVASLAKLLGALVLVERDWNPDAIVTVSARAAASRGSRLRLRAKERVPAGELLAAMLVASSNDACLALAEHAAGDGASFAARMNARAAALGMSGSHFADPCGLDAPRQGSTPADLLRLAQAVMAVPYLADVLAKPRGEVNTLGGRTISYATSNLLLGRLDGARGVKTGYTARAGNCLIGQATRGGTTVTVILLNAPDRWWTAAILIDEAFRVAHTS
jgi:D-alanyl-D-alanine carboxypeptidase (penicillin-binding protein 5/6)